jgi:hypothetical protein
MEERIARLEAQFEHIADDLKDVKGDLRTLMSDEHSNFRQLLWPGIGAASFLLATIAGAYLLLNAKADLVLEKVANLQVTVAGISAKSGAALNRPGPQSSATAAMGPALPPALQGKS